MALPEVDAGVPEVDAGEPDVDAGEPRLDAGAPDAGDPKGVVAGGACGCSLPGTRGDRGVAAALLAIALAAVVRR